MAKKPKKDAPTDKEPKRPADSATFVSRGEEPVVDLNVETSPNINVPVTPGLEASGNYNVETRRLMQEAKEADDITKAADLDNVADLNDIPPNK